MQATIRTDILCHLKPAINLKPSTFTDLIAVTTTMIILTSMTGNILIAMTITIMITVDLVTFMDPDAITAHNLRLYAQMQRSDETTLAFVAQEQNIKSAAGRAKGLL